MNLTDIGPMPTKIKPKIPTPNREHKSDLFSFKIIKDGATANNSIEISPKSVVKKVTFADDDNEPTHDVNIELPTPRDLNKAVDEL